MTAQPSGTSGLFASPSPWSLLTAARWLPTRFVWIRRTHLRAARPRERTWVARSHISATLGDSAKYANRTRKIPNTPTRKGPGAPRHVGQPQNPDRLRRHDVLRAPGRRALRADQRVHDAPEREDVARRPPAGAAAALDVLHQADQDERGAPRRTRRGSRPRAHARARGDRPPRGARARPRRSRRGRPKGWRARRASPRRVRRRSTPGVRA